MKRAGSPKFRGENSMSDTPSEAPGHSILPAWIKGPQDFVGGLVLVGVSLFALWACSDLQGMHGFSFGPGTAPRMFATLLMGLGAAVAVVGVVQEGRACSTIPGADRSLSWRASSSLPSRFVRWASSFPALRAS